MLLRANGPDRALAWAALLLGGLRGLILFTSLLGALGVAITLVRVLRRVPRRSRSPSPP